MKRANLAPAPGHESPSLRKFSINLEAFDPHKTGHFLELIRNFLIGRDLFFAPAMAAAEVSDLRRETVAGRSKQNDKV